ncbi:MAG: hypothetical protein N2167_05840 [Flavobacteriales bacterium]|nr:hypothetical protein [Flavobacteriales bacterium]
MKTSIVLFLILFSVFPVLSQEQDSIQNILINNSIVQVGDTLINLNKLNGGIVRYQISEDDLQTLKNNGLEINDHAMIVVSDPSMISNFLMFEVKTFASDHEWYINTIKLESTSKGFLVYISSDKIEMATGWRKDGKIYVVIAVVAVLFLAVIGYLMLLDRKIARLNK